MQPEENSVDDQMGSTSAGRKSSDNGDDEDDERIGELESVVRFWVAENCLEIATESSGRPSIQMIVLMAPLLYASPHAGRRRHFIAVAMAWNALRRFLSGRIWEALVDATMAAGIFSTGCDDETECAASAASAIRSEMAVASAALTVHVLLKRSWWAIVPLASYVAYSRRSLLDGAVRLDAKTRLSSDFGRICRIATLLDPHLQMAAGSRMFFIMPSAATDALEEMLFMDIVFAATCFSCFCLAARDDFVFGHRSSSDILVYLRLAYSICVSIFIVRACWIDRDVQADLADTSRSDLPPKRATQRALQYERCEERSRALSYRTKCLFLGSSVALALFHFSLIFNQVGQHIDESE